MPPAPFKATAWPDVMGAQANDRESLNRLCTAYWTPVVVYLRRRGVSRDDAMDGAQGFFAYFLEKNLIENVDISRGRFRRYLTAVLNRWLSNHRRVANAQKRGGGVVRHLPLECAANVAAREERAE